MLFEKTPVFFWKRSGVWFNCMLVPTVEIRNVGSSNQWVPFSFHFGMILFAGISKFQSTTCTLSWMWDVWFLLSVQRIWSHTKHDIRSLQIYHNSSSNEIWRSQWRLFFDCTINISNYKKPELAIDQYVPWKLTPKSAMTMSYTLDQQFFFLLLWQKFKFWLHRLVLYLYIS